MQTRTLGKRADVVVELMREWFELKNKQLDMGKLTSVYPESYLCSNMKPTNHNSYPQSCYDRTEASKDLPDDACQGCKNRKEHIRTRQANAARRAKILQEVKAIITVIDMKPTDYKPRTGEIKSPNTQPLKQSKGDKQ
jgi:hypothetical protein